MDGLCLSLSLSFKKEGFFPSPDSCFQISYSSLSNEFKWKINGPFHSQTHYTVTGYDIMHAASSSSFQFLILQNLPTVERLDPTFRPNVPAYQQGEDVTTQNCTCPRCSEVQRTQPRPMTWYPVEQQDPRDFGNVDAPHLNQDQIVDNRVPDRVWAPQTTVIQDGYPPVPEGAGPPQALLLEASIAESRRRLAGRYLNNPDVYVSTIRLEPGPDGELQVIITLGIANVL
ncbi:hypothetical protein EDB92DRAFT_1953883 [Lactarius akahatsu]|uniref:Uncharacterized protein n=1 Tax=Lactarius akahatsu TaxID=416441 RepID=A0AAD4Q3A3_9AGAM|nr:hypothetical protein EDB92DRAFT_1953883 [Lactarius akahatsu]